MIKSLNIALACLFVLLSGLHAAEKGSAPQSYQQIVDQRTQKGLKLIQDLQLPEPDKASDSLPLALLYSGEKIEEANRMVLAFCNADPLTTYIGKSVPKTRCEGLFRTYLQERTRKLLSPTSRKAIEDYAWRLLGPKYNRGITLTEAGESFFATFDSSENHYLNDRRRYHLALEIVRMSDRYGPGAKLEGQTIDSHCKAWQGFWIRYFRDRSNEGTDMEVAHPSSYGMCTVGVYYDLYDLIDNPELHKLAGDFLTLYWAEVASEFEPRTGQRAGWASTRNPFYDGMRTYWARNVLYLYNWHDIEFSQAPVWEATFVCSSYRPPEILSAIAHDPNRDCYQMTSRRAGMLDDGSKEFPVIFNENGGSHLRRDVYYTPDYALSTITYDPTRNYRTSITLAQAMGVTFAADLQDRITVMGTGYYARRAISGVTGKAVSIIARDPNAELGRARFKSDGTRIFISNGDLWQNRVEDPSGWFFTQDGDAYVAISAAGTRYKITETRFDWPNRKLKLGVEQHGHFLELEDMWAPIIIQMGRAADYKSFEDFQASVKDNRIDYKDGKLSYVSEAKETFEYWAKGTQLPQINGATVNLNPTKTFDSPFLSMVHGSKKAVISYPGFKSVELNF